MRHFFAIYKHFKSRAHARSDMLIQNKLAEISFISFPTALVRLRNNRFISGLPLPIPRQADDEALNSQQGKSSWKADKTDFRQFLLNQRHFLVTL